MTDTSSLATQFNKQVAGGFLSVCWVHDPELARPHLPRAARAGYGTWICFVRHMKLNLLDASVKNALRQLIDIAHEYELKFVLDTDPTHWAEDVTSRDPKAALWVIIPVHASVYNGEFEVFIQEPRAGRQSTVISVSDAYISGGATQTVPLEYEWQHIGKPFSGYQLRGKMPDKYQGQIKFYVTASTNSRIDHASKTYFAMQAELLDCYKDLPLDGLAWDEPGKGHGSLTAFRSGHDFLTLFKETNGYDLSDNLIYLDEFDETPQAVRVRCDYYRTLSDLHCHIQKVHFEQAKSIWGKNIILGTHPTWSGLPTDLAAGVFDHFRMSEVLSESWTDGGFHLERKVHIFTFILADSIKKAFNRRNSYFNDWILQPNASYYRLMNRIKTLWHINTFTHVYSDFTENLVATQLEPMKSLVDKDAMLLNNLDKLIDNRRGEAEFAVWYGWEGYASMHKSFSRCDYIFMENFSLASADVSLFFDFVSSELLFAGKVIDGKLHTSGGIYSALVMPYARVLPAGLWQKLLDFNRQGLKIVFVGPEPAFEADGKAIDFADATGFCSFGPASYLQLAKQKGFKIQPDEGETPFLDVVPQVKITDDSIEKITNEFGELVTLHNNKGIYWQIGLDPREDLVDLLVQWKNSSVQVYGTCIYHLFGTIEDGVLILAPKVDPAGWGITPYNLESGRDLQHEVKIKAFDGIIKYGKATFEFSHCEWAAIKIKDYAIESYLHEGNNFNIKKV